MRYTQITEIGRGGFARVFQVIGDDGKPYARKVFAPREDLVAHVGAEALRRRFIREVKCQSSISHPNVIPVVESFLEEDPPSFIMPFASGSLKEELENDRTLGGSPNQALFDILNGLEAIHNNGHVHRDLKPANVLRIEDGEGNSVYAISDLGLITDPDGDESTLTASGDAFGTQFYAAPEMIRSFRHATAAADIYSFGAILHDIFAPTSQRVPYSELNASGDIGEVISKCTKGLVLRRYRTAAEVREELYESLNNTDLSFSSSNEEAVVELLKSKDQLSDEEWDRVFIQIEDNIKNSHQCYGLFAAISSSHIDHLRQTAPDLFAAIGSYLCDHAREGSFDFDYCDVFANKLEIFYEGGELGLKAGAAVALLLLGVKHNRWYVERKFTKLVSPSISEELARRILTELDINEINYERYLSHMERSISTTRVILHPMLRNEGAS